MFYVTQRGHSEATGDPVLLWATTSKQHSKDCECDPISSWTGHQEHATIFDTRDDAESEADIRRVNGWYLRGYRVEVQ